MGSRCSTNVGYTRWRNRSTFSCVFCLPCSELWQRCVGLTSSHESGLILHTSSPFPSLAIRARPLPRTDSGQQSFVGCPVNLITHQLCGAENAQEGSRRVGGALAQAQPHLVRSCLSGWWMLSLPPRLDSVTSVTCHLSLPRGQPKCCLSLWPA